jgi:hypothetical protein
MDKFWQIASTFAWQKNSVCIAVIGVNISTHRNFDPLGYEPSTCEEFTAAALQAIEKLKAQGIDIGTDWLPKWEPKPGEVVFAWDDQSTSYRVGIFQGLSNNMFPYRYRMDGSSWQYIAPFTGEIPEPFKSRWEAEGNANQ